jgi:phage-related protein
MSGARWVSTLRLFNLGGRWACPVVDYIERDIWEVRSRLSSRIARVLFTLEGNAMILLHGFIKKDRKTPKPDLDLTRQRLKKLRSAP